ncbi:MAG: YIP1 family protein [Nanoarchaeota archaeon]|nr:YIP1 family protein [Nanoarchaeota archaeon]
MRNIIETIKSVVQEPSKFFKEITKEKSIKEALIFFIIFYGITLLFSFVQSIFSMQTMPGVPKIISYIMLPFSMMFALAISFGSIFLFTLVFHGFFKLFKGKGLYKDSFNLFIYAAAPSFVLGLIMAVINAIVVIISQNPMTIWYLMIPAIPLYLGAFVWNAVLVTIGGSILHRISRLNSFLAGVLMPFILGLVILGFMLLIFGLGLFVFLSQSGFS